MVENSSWITIDPEDKFKGTALKKRAEKRTVRETGDVGVWVVDGDGKLGDAYPEYKVTLPEGEMKYVCECYGHGQGHHRRRKMCSHVLAVVLYRKNRKPDPVIVDDVDEAVIDSYPKLEDLEPPEPKWIVVDEMPRRGDTARAGGRDAAAAKGEDEGESVAEADGVGDGIDYSTSGRFNTPTHKGYPDDPIALNDPMLGSPPFPEKFVQYRDHQWDAIVEIMEHLEAGVKVVMLSAPTGCLAGDTMITGHYEGDEFRRTIKDVVGLSNWGGKVPIYVKRSRGDGMEYGVVKRAWESGLKETFLLTTENGRDIRATAMHPFLKEDGAWTVLSDLKAGDRIQVLVYEKRKQRDDGTGGYFWQTISVDTVQSIIEYGYEPTFDIEMVNDPHNFIANGFVVHNSGKTVIAESVRRLHHGRAAYCATTKTLQDQIESEFPYARVIKGRTNYPTEHRRDLTAEDCTGTSSNGYECDWCSSRGACPYQQAKQTAAMAPLPVLNTSYFLSETKARLGSHYLGRELIIIDEGDGLEDQLLGFIEVVITGNLRRSIGVMSMPKKTVATDWIRWLGDEVLPAIRLRQGRLRTEARNFYGEDVKVKRQIKRLEALADKIKPLLVENEDGECELDNGWVLTGYQGKDPTLRFKPVRVDRYAKDVLWDRGKQFLLMSATLISPQQMAQDLGLEDDEWEVVTMDSTFPIERRPVFVTGNISMSYKSKDKAWPQMVDAVEKVMNENLGVRILVHTVSYQLTRHLMDNIESTRTLSYNDARQREMVLSEFLDTADAVLLAPSFERGVDLPEEDCQVIVIAKIPYPSLGDKQVAARLYGKNGQSWYAVQTIRAIVQMTGRGMRSADDWCDSVILDAQFKRLYRDNKRMFPKWWRDAVVLSMTDPKNRPMLEAMRERKAGR